MNCVKIEHSDGTVLTYSISGTKDNTQSLKDAIDIENHPKISLSK